MGRKKSVVITVALVCCGISVSAEAITYTINDITLEGETLIASGINNRGQVVAYTGKRSYVWKDGIATPIEGPQPPFEMDEPWEVTAVEINDFGQVVGDLEGYTIYGSTAFLWQNGSMETRPHWITSWAGGINNAGQVVIGAEDGRNWNESAYLWENGKLTPLGNLDSDSDPWSFPNAINDSGQIVGVASTSAHPHAFLWENGVMSDLGTLGDRSNSKATDINNSGQVVGFSNDGPISNFGGHAVLWDEGTIIDLGTLGGTDSYAVAINDLGLVVGNSRTAAGEWHAFLWENGLMVDLNDLLGSGSDREIVAVSDINNRGQIIGNYRNSFGFLSGILLNPSDAPAPVPEPATMLLTGLGLAGAGLSGLRRKKGGAGKQTA